MYTLLCLPPIQTTFHHTAQDRYRSKLGVLLFSLYRGYPTLAGPNDTAHSHLTNFKSRDYFTLPRILLALARVS